MNISSGKLYVNRTWRYLYPCLSAYGPEFMVRINNLFKLAVGIDDLNLYGHNKDNCIFILLDSEIPLATKADYEIYKRNFSKFLTWISYQPYYVTDYVFDDVFSGKKHMVVIKIPPQFHTSYTHFLNGSYSQMYNSQQIREIFKNDRYNVLPVLKKDRAYLKEKFVSIVNDKFDSDATEGDLVGSELDFKPEYKEEIFNF